MTSAGLKSVRPKILVLGIKSFANTTGNELMRVSVTSYL